jgi:hypothetical protein
MKFCYNRYNARGKDKEEYRSEFILLVKMAIGFKLSANNGNEK